MKALLIAVLFLPICSIAQYSIEIEGGAHSHKPVYTKGFSAPAQTTGSGSVIFNLNGLNISYGLIKPKMEYSNRSEYFNFSLLTHVIGLTHKVFNAGDFTTDLGLGLKVTESGKAYSGRSGSNSANVFSWNTYYYDFLAVLKYQLNSSFSLAGTLGYSVSTVSMEDYFPFPSYLRSVELRIGLRYNLIGSKITNAPAHRAQ